MPEKVEIGLPPTAYLQDPVNEKELAKKTLPFVDIFPMDTDMVSDFSESLLLYKLKPADDAEAPPPLRIYFEQKSFTETFTNNLTESFLQSILRTSSNLSQITQMLGGKGIHEVIGSMIGGIPLIGGIASGIGSAVGSLIPESIKESIASSLRGDRFSLPKLWQDSSYVINCNLSFKLYCKNPANDDEYNQYVVEPIKLLLKYVLPRSTTKDGLSYRWPYFVIADAGALFSIPEGMITELSIEKGYENSISIHNRPSIVKVDLTISYVRNIMVQKWKDNVATMPLNHETYIKQMQKKSKLDLQEAFTNKPSNIKTAQTQQLPNSQLTQNDIEIFNKLK